MIWQATINGNSADAYDPVAEIVIVLANGDKWRFHPSDCRLIELVVVNESTGGE